MKVKKYTGENMQDVIFQVKADLGSEAVIVNKRKFKKGGIFGFFGKEMFEVVAALEDNSNSQTKTTTTEEKTEREDDIVEISNYGKSSKNINREDIQKTASEDPENKNAIKEFISDIKTASDAAAQKDQKQEKKLKNDKQKANKFKNHLNQKQEKYQKKNKKNSANNSATKENSEKKESTIENNNTHTNNKSKKEVKTDSDKNLTAAQKLQKKFQNKNSAGESKNLNNSNQLYNYLLDQGVDSRNVNLFFKKMDSQIESETKAEFEEKLKGFLKDYFAANGEIKIDSEQKIVSFIGPTGVGKTTTMAKIAAHFSVDKNKKVGLITADTYRIAAVEQLQTYSEIIDIPFAVCYSSSKLEEMLVGKFRNCDLILIDTPGSSWKDELQLGRLKDYADHDFVDEVHLLLSLNTKSSDLRSIVSKFSQLKPDKALLTKLDETSSYGDIINIKENYNLDLSYLTCGQDVPEDLEIASANQIYKYLFGDFYA